jgi:hypothetical protein
MEGKMHGEHLYHWLIKFFTSNPKTSWKKNELLEAIKEQYIDILKKNQENDKS